MPLIPVFPDRSLNRLLTRDRPADADDVLDVKNFLRTSGHYAEPAYGMTRYPDQGLFTAISDYQREHGLQVDGVMKPDGETQQTMRGEMGRKFQTPDVLEIKKDFFDNDKLKGRRELFANYGLSPIKDMTQRRFDTYMTTYVMEGGDRSDGDTVSGIQAPTLAFMNSRQKLGLKKNAKPADLTPLEKARVLEAYADYSFERVGGRKALDDMPDDMAAKAVFDTVVRHGPEGGSLVLRKALNAVRIEEEEALSEGAGRIGPQTAERFKAVIGDKGRRAAFYQALAAERLKQFPAETMRFEYFRD